MNKDTSAFVGYESKSLLGVSYGHGMNIDQGRGCNLVPFYYDLGFGLC